MKSRSVTRAAGYIAVAAASVFISSNVLAAGITLSQCANGGVKDLNDSHLECSEGWISGNANQTKAAYAEGQFLPYRVVITGLTPEAEYTYSFSWDTLKKSKHALDYIGSFDATVTGADLCQGLGAGCPTDVDVIDIPTDTVVTTQGVTPLDGDMTALGAEFLGIGPYGVEPGDPPAEVQSLAVQFKALGETVILGWSGHIASPSDWEDGNTAADINGSPYHTANIALVDANGVSVASGNQDVALSAAAIYVPSATTVRKISNRSGMFTFQASLDNTTLSPDGEDATWTVEAGPNADGQSVIRATDDGTLTISEIDLPEGDWRIKSITCTKFGGEEVFSYVYGDGPEVDTASFEVTEAGTFDCVFENEFFGAPVLGVVKRVIGADDSCTESVRTDDQYDSRDIRSGETVKYCYWVGNTGSDAALDLVLTDDLATLTTADDETIDVTGGSEIGGDPAIPDLAPGATLSGELIVQLNEALDSVVVNTATASGTGQYDNETYTASDTATVNVNQSSSCTLDATVFAGVGTCPGASTAYVIGGIETAVTWCANVMWDDKAVLDLENITVELDGTDVSSGGFAMAPNSSQDIEVGQYRDPENVDFTGTLVLTGWEGGMNKVTCSGDATINVLDPGLNLVKTVSTDDVCGDSDDGQDIQIINGESVWYCLKITNTGDSILENISIDDIQLGENILIKSRGLDESYTWQSEAQQPSSTITNTAVAMAMEPKTRTLIGPEQSSATVTVLSADVKVEKRADPGSIVLCGPEGGDFCTADDGDGVFDVSYEVVVTNLGPYEATGVTVSDDLPEGFSYAEDDAGCVYDAVGHELDCGPFNLMAGMSKNITISGTIDTNLFDLPWQAVRNQACARTDPVNLDPEPGNNCDDASTHISTGPTRTIGWWGNHPEGLAACLDEGEIDLGFVILRDEAFDDEIDATVSTNPTAPNRARENEITPLSEPDDDSDLSTGVELAKGLINAGTAQWKDGTRRSEVDQERIKTGRQLTAAWCNEVLFGSEFDYFYLGWETIQSIMLGELCFPDLTEGSCLASNGKTVDLDLVIASINAVGSVADAFNNSGDNQPVDFESSPADPKAPEDDPTDPSD